MNRYPKVCAIHGSPNAGQIKNTIVKANLAAIERILTSPAKFPKANRTRLAALAVEYIGILQERGLRVAA